MNPRLPGTVGLSPTRSVQNWIDLQPDSLIGADPKIWEEIVQHYFRDRLESRYLKPIRKIKAPVIGETLGVGEGFAMVVLQCSLIEFLQSCFDGSNYRNDGPLGPNEYRDSKTKFTDFLTGHDPFKQEFDLDTAQSFYRAVRCGLLHEARTKGKWLIHDDGLDGKILAQDKRTVCL